ncbi:DUF6942 family protein [Thalassotalea sp. ND16A]|uniref:DUF6942 family protein n=1 Tax=Thalassotalea sp. ND16A TaxID=1535422 RepID=UPI000519FAF8|nr:hypothetical protein [Thalassotalea sp. ND16A]KGJ99617.1 hypothetical protein ND16A_3717 [Thalassotalea sp. ND16A]
MIETDNKQISGLGELSAPLKVYLDNRPPLEQYQSLVTMQPMVTEEISDIGRLTGNHWRKIFNVYAKLCFELAPKHFHSWQELRDRALLQKGSEQALLFNQPSFNHIFDAANDANTTDIHIIMGRTYAARLVQPLPFSQHLLWLDKDFAINPKKRLIICPYFDYRQLSNVKITQLVKLIKTLQKKHS